MLLVFKSLLQVKYTWHFLIGPSIPHHLYKSKSTHSIITNHFFTKFHKKNHKVFFFLIFSFPLSLSSNKLFLHHNQFSTTYFTTITTTIHHFLLHNQFLRPPNHHNPPSYNNEFTELVLNNSSRSCENPFPTTQSFSSRSSIKETTNSSSQFLILKQRFEYSDKASDRYSTHTTKQNPERVSLPNVKNVSGIVVPELRTRIRNQKQEESEAQIKGTD